MGQGQSGGGGGGGGSSMQMESRGDQRRSRRRRRDDNSDSDSDSDIENKGGRGGGNKNNNASGGSNNNNNNNNNNSGNSGNGGELRGPPPDVMRSAGGSGGGGGEIKTELMGDGGDDDVSPAMAEKLARLREEKRRRAMDKDAQRAKEKEYPLIYGGPCTGSNEFNAMVYAIVKLVLYVALLAVCARVLTTDYGLKQCFLSDDNRCLFSNVTHVCLTTSNEACGNLCRTDFPASFAQAGCIREIAKPTELACLPNFDATCIAADTCPAKPNKELYSAVKIAAAIFGVFVVLELVYAWAMASFKSLHITDFDRLTKFQKCLAVSSKAWGLISQLLWFLGLLSAAYLFYIHSKYEASCAHALTTRGEPYQLFKECFLLAIGVLLAHLLLSLIGTWFRARRPLRGSLYRSSNDGEIRVPFGADCKACRDRPRPRWFSSCFKPHMSREDCVGCMCNCTSFAVDGVCCLSFEILGWGCERVYTHRHFIGP